MLNTYCKTVNARYITINPCRLRNDTECIVNSSHVIVNNKYSLYRRKLCKSMLFKVHLCAWERITMGLFTAG